MNEHERTRRPVRHLLMVSTLLLVVLPMLTLVGFGIVYSARVNAQEQSGTNYIEDARKVLDPKQSNSFIENHQSLRAESSPMRASVFGETQSNRTVRLRSHRDNRQLELAVSKLVRSIQLLGGRRDRGARKETGRTS